MKKIVLCLMVTFLSLAFK